MPVPIEYTQASRQFDAFLQDAKEEFGFPTSHMAYTTVQSVLFVFRARLTVQQAIGFAAALPAVLRAIFVTDWDPSRRRQPFGGRAQMNAEVKTLRANHNFSPDDAIECVAAALWRHVDARDFEAALARLPPEARDFWGPPR